MSCSKLFHADRKPGGPHGVFSKRLGEQSSFLDVEHVNDTSCSDFMKVAVPFNIEDLQSWQKQFHKHIKLFSKTRN